METTTSIYRFYFKVTVKTKFGNGDVVEGLGWNNLPWTVRNKYDWYFKYRAALLQVKYPRYDIEVTWGKELNNYETEERTIKNRIAARRRKISEYENKLKLAEETWCSLFPIQDYPLYQQAKSKIQRLKIELNTMLIK